MINTFSAFKINNPNNIPFSKEEYSRFKYGSKTIAKKFGYILYEKFIQSKQFNDIVNENKQILIVSSPYKNIPTATFALKDYFCSRLNVHLVDLGLNPIQELKISRQQSYNEDYGAMDAEQRTKLIFSDDFYIDANFCKDKILLFLDDVKITGTHENVIKKLITDFKLDNEIFYFLYFAELTDSNINPTIENELNYAFVKNIKDINWIIHNDKFQFNTRVTKYILSSNHDEFKHFADYQSERFNFALMTNGYANGYAQQDEYKRNLAYLRAKNNL